MSWSGGKDSALALHEVIKTGCCEVRALLTTVTADFDRISMHGVRRSLLHAQASSLGLPLEVVWIPKGASNETYEERMRAALSKHKGRGVDEVAFGDLFLRDIRDYREDRLGQMAMRGLFPLWGRDTGRLSREFIELGFRAVVCCVDPRRLGKGVLWKGIRSLIPRVASSRRGSLRRERRVSHVCLRRTHLEERDRGDERRGGPQRRLLFRRPPPWRLACTLCARERAIPCSGKRSET